jgi:hypothetical protein
MADSPVSAGRTPDKNETLLVLVRCAIVTVGSFAQPPRAGEEMAVIANAAGDFDSFSLTAQETRIVGLLVQVS